MVRAAVLVSCLCCATQLPGATYRSGALGWKAGQDVTREFGALVKNLESGDKLVLDARYDLAGGSHQFPDDFTLEAVKDGGFNITDTSNVSTFRLGHRNVLRNLTLSNPNAPRGTKKTTNPKRDVDYVGKKVISVSGKDDCVFEYCKFEGNIGTHIAIGGGNRHVIRHCHVVGGYWAVTFGGACLDWKVQQTYFENVVGECIKTLRGHKVGTQRALIEHCVFQGAWRDGIDTTGGFKDSIIRDCIFRRNDVGGVGGGIDLKKLVETATVEGDLDENVMNKNVRIERCQFIDLPNAVVVSLIDRAGALTAVTAPMWAPHEIQINDCVVEKTEGWQGPVRFLLVKGGHTIRWTDLQRRGDVVLVRKSTFKVGGDEVVGALYTDIGGKECASAAPRSYSGDVPFDHGPRTDSQTPQDGDDEGAAERATRSSATRSFTVRHDA